MFKINRSTLLFTLFSLLFSTLLVLGLVDLSNKFEEASKNFSKATKAFQIYSPSIDRLQESLKPGMIPDLILYYALEGDADYLKSAIKEAEQAISILEKLQSVAEDQVIIDIIENLNNGFSALASVEINASTNLLEQQQARENIKGLDLYNPVIVKQYQAQIASLRSRSSNSLLNLERKNELLFESLSKETIFGWVMALLLIATGLLFIRHLRGLEKLASDAHKNTLLLLSSEKALAEQANYAERLFTAIPVAVITINERGEIQSSNPATARLLGYSPEEILHQKVNMLMPDHHARQHDQYLDNYHKTKVANVIGIGREVRARHKDGHEVDVHLSITEFKLHDKKHYAGILVDLSEITSQRDEIAKTLIALEESNIELEKAMKQVNIASEAKDMFLATASHEIRTPLTGMFGMIDLLRDSDLNKEQQSYIKMLDGSGRQLMAILNDILDAAKLRENGIELHPTSNQLSTVTSLINSTFTATAELKRISFSVLVEETLNNLWVNVDSVRLVQVLSNLCNNAIKFTDHGYVNLAVAKCEETKASICLNFSIEDSGSGIPENLISELGKPFTQLDNSLTRSGKGTGLGITIVTALLEKMGSKLKIESTIGKGSTFSFKVWLPKSEEPVHHHILKTVDSSSLQTATRVNTAKILVAEDNPINRMVIEKLLTKLQLEFLIVENGQELVHEAERNAYDLILTDIQMPIMDGLTATRELRKQSKFDHIPIVALTAASFEDEIEKMRSAGMNDYVAKPIDREKLISAIVSNLRKQPVD